MLMFLIYSATGGADSRPLSPTQLEADAEGAGGVGNGEDMFLLDCVEIWLSTNL